MKRLSRLFIGAVLALAAPFVLAAESIDIPYEKYELDNGLTLIVHQDSKAPIVAVNVWYHVGSKDEPEGKTGFAHLFEHLMFNGSENFNDDFFKALDKLGATGTNGTTNFDRTNYFEVVPKTALDSVLWLESDRMGHMLGAVTQERLDEQRGVVQNEKRQGENQPYGKAFLTIFENMYPEGHPYSHSVIGSMEDLNAASLDDVHEWFKKYYGPSNAVIAIAGDITPEEAKAKVEQYFGHIQPGPPLTKPKALPMPRENDARIVMEDRVPQARLYKVWNISTTTDADTDYLSLAGDVLSNGKSSRLYKRLVYDMQVATDVNAFAYGLELGGLFGIIATAAPGEDLAEIERIIDQEVAQLLEDGPDRDELERAKTSRRAGFLRGIERIGGFGGKSDQLASSEVYYGSPDGWKDSFNRQMNADDDDVQDAARRWLSKGALSLEVHPFPEYAASGEGVDRSKGMPQPQEFPEGRFPEVQTATLDNGLTIKLAERRAVPLVEMSLVVDAGYAADQLAVPGTANLSMAMLDEGTESRSALEISDELIELGANLSAGSSLDVSTVSMDALRSRLEPSFELFADVVLNPAFPSSEFDRLKKQQLASIQREKVQPVSMALRVMPKLLYGEGHAYSNPLTGSGTMESVQGMTREQLRDFHGTWFKPNNATLVVVGDISMDELLPLVREEFGDWNRGDVPVKNLDTVEHKDDAVVYIVDRPDSQQSIIFSGHVMPPKNNDDEFALQAMVDVFGGSFTSRLNMNLREDKHWAYGARALLYTAEGQRPFIAYAPVQSDKTAESMTEILKELRGIEGKEPVTAEELAKVKNQNVLTLPGRWETNGAVLRDLREQVQFDLPADYWPNYGDNVRNLGLDAVRSAGSKHIEPGRLVWVVVGDRKQIEAPVRELGIGEIRFLDADGNPVD
ncbi:MAG: pitrilysin family protein [Gammaproteobacteria bacterium]|nr:pitrilysin family protein [Gammaproteobacteria bacterium]